MNKMQHLTPIAAAAALAAACGPAFAFEQIDLGNGLKLDARINLTYTLATRLKNQDPVLKGSSGSNDGNNNFNKNALTANRLGAFFDGKLSKDASGLVVSASTFYDDVYHQGNDNNPGNGQPGAGYNPNGVSKAPPFNEFTREARRYHGGYSRFLDAYGYTSFNVGEQSKLNLRVGRHVVSWGEALFMPPVANSWFLRSAMAWERAGEALSMPFAGVHIVEATKQVYRALPAHRERVRLIPSLQPVLVPSPSARG